jgi:hypothetical protein
MGLLTATLDAFEDENAKETDLIKSGTLRTTRGTALVAVSVVSIMALLNELAPEVTGLDDLSAEQKFNGAIAIGFIWAITSAADALARGLAAAPSTTAASSDPAAAYAVAMDSISSGTVLAHSFRVINPPLPAQLIDKEANDESGWLVVASAIRAQGIEFCVVKGAQVEWRSPADRGLRWTIVKPTEPPS